MSIAKRLGRVSTATCLVGIMGVTAVGCLSRPAVKGDPTTKTNFVSKVRQQAVDKIDLVLAIDNSASMGDKQTFLARAVPRLVSRLVTPSCVAKGSGVKNEAGIACPNADDDLEFRPINDIHIAVITSSMGGFGSSTCADDPAFNNNDRGLPIPRAKDATGKATTVNAEDGNFLAWFPANDENAKKPQPAKPYTDVAVLGASVASLVRGAGENGCGLEAQLESVYRFLVQPDPWNAIKVDGGRAVYDGVANDVIKARKQFLRNDSLVAVIMLTDEDDSSVDPISIAGSGWAFMANDFPTSSFVPPEVRDAPGRKRAEKDFLGGTTAPRGTSVCETNPMSKDCTSCAFKYGCSNFLDKASCDKLAVDPNCSADNNNGYHTQKTDSLNVRFHRMKMRYGVDPQYPLKRYVAGFTRQVVPNRLGEHDASGAYIDDTNGVHGCTNPLFAKTLPDEAGALVDDKSANALVAAKNFSWCQGVRGDRDEGLVFFAVVGGVPNELLHYNPTDSEASQLSEEDWKLIVGQDPVNFNYAGVDKRMYQSITPREGRRTDGLDAPAQDPLNTDHRDWDTRDFDLQYACTFPLPADLQRDLTPQNARAFDCTAGSDAPLCSSDKPKDQVRKQIRAKAYPTVRELQVARLLGAQGIAASLCPQKAEGSEDDPLFGYNPAVASVVDRLKNALTAQCLPRQLTPDPVSREVQCLMIEELPYEDKRACSAIPGRSEVPADVAARFREAQKAEQGANVSAEEDRTKRTICQIKQLTVKEGESCRFGEAGWCYVSKTATSNPAGRCSQAIVFSDTGVKQVPGGTVNLQCINQEGSGTAAK
ncbi:MAG: hypothetical protein U0174_20440 [Polyangiaceae bacterium]